MGFFLVRYTDGSRKIISANEISAHSVALFCAPFRKKCAVSSPAHKGSLFQMTFLEAELDVEEVPNRVESFEVIAVVPLPKPSGIVNLEKCELLRIAKNAQRCFPATERKKFKDGESSSEEESDDEEIRRKRRKEEEEDLRNQNPFFAPTKFQVFDAISELGEFFEEEFKVTVEICSLLQKHYPSRNYDYATICWSLSKNSLVTSKKFTRPYIPIGAVLFHSLAPGKHDLFIPAIGFSKSEYSRDADASEYTESEDENVPISWFFSKIYSLNSTIQSGGKTSDALMKDMKLRHASGSMNYILPPTLESSIIYSLYLETLTALSSTDFTYSAPSFSALRFKPHFGTHPHKDMLIQLTRDAMEDLTVED